MLLFFYLITINLISFALYAYDKKCAVNSTWRVSEKTLLLVGFLGGSLGAYLGMHLLRHKTRHKKFQIIIPILLTIHIILLILNYY